MDSDCHVALGDTIGVSYTEKYYEVLIGGWDNSRSVLRECVGDGLKIFVFCAAYKAGFLKRSKND